MLSGQLDHLAAAYRGDGQRVAFLYVYLNERSRQDRPSGAQGPRDPSAGLEERRRRVRELAGVRELPFPCAFDDDDGGAEKAYDARPQRLVVIGADGRVAFDAGHGKLSIWDMDEVRRHLEDALHREDRTLPHTEARATPGPSGRNGSS